MIWKNKKILITGGLGFIGHNIAIHAIKNGAESIFIFDDQSRNFEFNQKNYDKILHAVVLSMRDIDFQVVKTDVSKIPTDSFSKTMSECDIVIHLAAKVGGIDYYLDNAFEVFNKNVKIDQNVIESFINSEAKTFMYASSSHVYSKKELWKWMPAPILERSSESGFPELSYGAAKLFGEKLLLSSEKLLRQKKKRVIIPRLVGIYGKGMDIDVERASLIPALIHKSISSHVHVKSPGYEVRTYLHIEDAISAIECILGLKGNVWPMNVCSTKPYKVSDIAEMVVRTGDEITYEVDKKPFIEWQVCANTKLKEGGWEQVIDLRDGIEQVYKDILEDRL